MNLQERDQLNGFLQQLVNVSLPQKDAEADALIREACAKQPAAAYLLVQRAMQLEAGFLAAQAQCAQLQAELEKSRSSSTSSFLNDANAWGRPAAAKGTPPLAASPAQTPALRPTTATQQPLAPAAPAWGSSMLGTVATTAAGVVAASFLFQGIQGMMGHHNQAPNAAANPPMPEANKLAANTDDTTDLQNDSNYFADAGSSDFDSGDVT